MAKSLLSDSVEPISDVDTYIKFYEEKEKGKAIINAQDDLSSAKKKKKLNTIESNFKKTVENLEHVKTEAHIKMSEKENRVPKQAGGSMMVPPERETYAEGGEESLPLKEAWELADERRGPLERGIVYNITDKWIRSGWPDRIGNWIAEKVGWEDKEQSKSVREQFNRAFKGAREAGESEFIFKGEPFHTRTVEEMATEEVEEKTREPRQEGGSMMVPPEMEEVVSSEAPVDTYPNIPPEEMAEVEASQLPDQEMEDDYVDFVISEALEQEEQEYLRNTLEADPQLSMIFDKVVETASEFSGSGEVAGPGTGVSDSIPARLSDGEFVVTKKATDQLGADNLQSLMDEAERAFDGGLMERDRSIEDEEIRKAMVASNQMPSLNVRQR